MPFGRIVRFPLIPLIPCFFPLSKRFQDLVKKRSRITIRTNLFLGWGQLDPFR